MKVKNPSYDLLKDPLHEVIIIIIDTNESLNLGQTTKPCNQQEKENFLNCELGCPADHGVKLKENEK